MHLVYIGFLIQIKNTWHFSNITPQAPPVSISFLCIKKEVCVCVKFCECFPLNTDLVGTSRAGGGGGGKQSRSLSGGPG